jgi:glycosyltransferase involved in cell wall biosynthesis
MELNLDNNISIIIPVYNAGSFVEKAVESALMQPETKEVILIEDRSTDNSLEVCHHIIDKYSNVKLYTHPGNVNKGAGISRNLGIKNATAEFIAFLDADDYYLPGRFSAERKIFEQQPDTDGVYGALGFHYYSEEGKKKYRQDGYRELTTLSGKVLPEQLYLSLLWLHPKVNGHFHLDALTVKRESLLKQGLFFKNLQLHEDTVFIIQLAMICRLQAGSIDSPVGMRGVHRHNRIVNRPARSTRLILQWHALYHWAAALKRSKKEINLFKNFFMKERVLYATRPKAVLLFFWFSATNRFFRSERMFFNPCCLYVFGKFGNYVIVGKEKILKKNFGSEYSISHHLLNPVQ